MVCLAFERLLAIYWPLRVKRILSLRFTLLLLCVPAFVTALYFVLVVVEYSLLYTSNTQFGSCVGDYNLPSFIYYSTINEITSILCSTLNIGLSVAVAFRCALQGHFLVHKPDSHQLHLQQHIKINLQAAQYSTRAKISARDKE